MALALPFLSCTNGQAKGERPNIIVILTDDMGFSDLGCYGGEVMTPNIDNLAENGLRWSQFYNNARSCPSRAALMTGLYPHQTGMGWMACADQGLPGYAGTLNNHCMTIAEVLGGSGYETYMVGKWHLCSERQCEGNVTETWPTGRGFRHFYGHPEGASDYFNARLVNGDKRLPKTGDGFYLTDAITDTAASYVSRHNYDEKPLFLYLAFNAPHWPLHALQKDIDKYVERYKAGWDVLRDERFKRQIAMGLFAEGTELSDRDKKVPAWDSLTPAKQKEYTMRMAIYAAQIDAIDRGVGKVVEALKKTGQFDNTVIMLMDDNGACAENLGKDNEEVTGQAGTWESYRINWANLSSTPYRLYKHYTNEGGIATPLIVSWPDGIARKRNGSFVRDYGYFTDIMATCVEVGKATYPKTFNGNEITPCEGTSLVPNFKGKTTDRGMTFWEHEGKMAVRDGNWKLVIINEEGAPVDMTKYELYDMSADPTELHNLASKYPEKVKSMMGAWDEWAKRCNVYPVSTERYGQRQQGYKRTINGEFDDNFGGWDTSSEIGTTFSIEKDEPISGKKSARIDVIKKGSKPDASILEWTFPTVTPMTASVGFTYKCDKANSLWLSLRPFKAGDAPVLYKKVSLKAEGGKVMFENLPIEKGRYQVKFYLGESEPGRILIDNVILELKEK